jgi:Cysteine-rich secretory protein family
MKDINKYASNKRKIGHFTAMVTDRSTQIGCAISTFKGPKGNKYLLACNYASTNLLGCPVYNAGKAASSCSGGTDSSFPGLCKSTEKIDPNGSCKI